jgi:hypothetical protein
MEVKGFIVKNHENTNVFFIDSSHGFSNDSHHTKPSSISDEEGE